MKGKERRKYQRRWKEKGGGCIRGGEREGKEDVSEEVCPKDSRRTLQTESSVTITAWEGRRHLFLRTKGPETRFSRFNF